MILGCSVIVDKKKRALNAVNWLKCSECLPSIAEDVLCPAPPCADPP